jgi:hypothetical protein
MSRIKAKKQGVNNSLVFTNQDNNVGTITFNGSVFTISAPVTFSGSQQLLGDGTAAAPSLAFSNTKVMGIYSAGSNVIGFSTAGSERVTIDAQGDLNIYPYISIGNGGTGQIVGDKKAVVEGTGAAVPLTAADSGKVFFINGDTGATAYTLPATVAGLHFKWIWTANCNNAITIATADTTDTSGDMFRGGLLISSAAAVNNFLESAADMNLITVDDNAADKAGGPGTWIEVICTEDTTWFVHGVVNSTSDTDSTGAHFTDVD